MYKSANRASDRVHHYHARQKAHHRDYIKPTAGKRTVPNSIHELPAWQAEAILNHLKEHGFTEKI